MRNLVLLSMLGAVLLLLGASASAAPIVWVPIGNPGNDADTEVMNDGTTGYGAVAYEYQISKYEVTNAQYAEFLNAAAAGQSDPLGLYNTEMGSGFGGITRTIVGTDYHYDAIASREDMPVNYVTFYDTLRFANWLNNGQGGSGSTETGAYTLEGGTETPSNGTTVTRELTARIFLTSEDEWYKAAYHDALGLAVTGYFDYPAGSDTATACTAPPGTGNDANCNSAVGGDLTAVGRYTGGTSSDSPYGTFDQGGNVWERTEAIIFSGEFRVLRGGSFVYDATALAASVRGGNYPAVEYGPDVGFRVASLVPEPGTGLLVIAGLLGLGGWRRGRA